MKTLIIYFLFVLSLNFGNGDNALVQRKGLSEISKTNITFISNGLLVKGWLFKPADSGNKKLPVIVMAPGFSGTKECNYQYFATNFAKEGFAVLLFDFPNFGESGSLLKGEVEPWQQIQAYRDGISYVASLDDIDDSRIGVWGGSYSGGHVIVVSALDNRVKCLVAMTPFISGRYYVNNLSTELKNFLFQQFNSDRLLRIKGEKPTMIPVATNKSGEFAAISSPYAWEFIQSFKDYALTYENFVTLRSLELQLEYEPGFYVQNIGAKPKLFIIAKNDELVPEELIIATFNHALEPKELIYIDGNHFSPYMEGLPEASKTAVDWFKKNL